MPTESACRAEVERLHDCFVAWFAGTAARDDFDAIADALAPGFEMVVPDGSRRGRDAVLDAIRSAYGRDDPGAFDIDIRNVEVRHDHADCATVRYEEWQGTPDRTTSRVSTALVREDDDAPNGLLWVDVHETWMDGP
ncbi:DUF4440 domain-containing protein [Halobaculum limi]|uniref:DUF4440 domain-containing protein n=1 Tax=Halobaculum limi TaxID=3031916 RepID=UPI0024052BD0|nr:DUF4440 domain-containing protein [Halobaculum sp. YSMS11]